MALDVVVMIVELLVVIAVASGVVDVDGELLLREVLELLDERRNMRRRINSLVKLELLIFCFASF